jgi:hypothetical protein
MIPFYNSAPSKFAGPIPVISGDALAFLQTKPTTPPAPVPTIKYDEASFSKLTNLSNELLAKQREQTSYESQVAAQTYADGEIPKKTKTSSSDIDTSDTSKDNLLAMIFKIVPIGINIANKGKTIVQGFKEASKGIVDLLKNTAILTGIIGVDTINFYIELCIYIFKLLVCVVEKMFNFPKCVIFYLIDIVCLLVIALIISVLFIVDVILNPKLWVGKSCVEGFIAILLILDQIDRWVYKMASFHLFHYPEQILEMCYNCVAMRNTSGFKRVASRWFREVFIQVPRDIGGPVGDTMTGIGHIFGFFDLSS